MENGNPVRFRVRNRPATTVVGNQELALGFEVALTNAVNYRFKVTSTTGSHHAYFKHGAKNRKII
jgi:hypothetical protein